MTLKFSMDHWNKWYWPQSFVQKMASLLFMVRLWSINNNNNNKLIDRHKSLGIFLTFISPLGGQFFLKIFFWHLGTNWVSVIW